MHLDRLATADSVLQHLTEVDGLVGIETLRGEVAAREGRADEARQHYRKAIAQRPDDCVPHASLALLAAQENDRGQRDGAAPPSAAAIDSAIAAAERLTGVESFRCNVLLGLAGMAAKRFDLAARHFQVALGLDPDNREVLLDLAMAQQETGDSAAALRSAREVLRLDPESAAALNFVGYVMAERGEQLSESERLIRKAVAKEPQNGYFVDSLGWVLYQKGEYADAVAALRRAVRLTEGKDALILEHLGDACAKLGELAEARDNYSLARNLDPGRRILVTKLAELEARLRRP
jgi:Tfp pilus assembly protein PilF